MGGGYLFLPVAVGIAIGAVLAGQLSKEKVEPGISCISGFFVGVLFLLLHLFSGSLILVILILGLLGIFGGAFVVPFDAFIQINSPKEKRGQVIAATAFLSFLGVFLAAFFIFAINEQMGFSASTGFVLMGFLTILASFVLMGRLLALFTPFFIRKVLKNFRSVSFESPLPDPSAVLILMSSSWWDAILLFALIPNLKILLPAHPFKQFPWINGWSGSIRFVSPEPFDEPAIDPDVHPSDSSHPCLFFRNKGDTPDALKDYERLLKTHRIPISYIHGKTEKLPRRFVFFRYWHRRTTVRFSSQALADAPK